MELTIDYWNLIGTCPFSTHFPLEITKGQHHLGPKNPVQHLRLQAWKERMDGGKGWKIKCLERAMEGPSCFWIAGVRGSEESLFNPLMGSKNCKKKMFNDEDEE